MEKVSFGYSDVAPDEKTRRVGEVFRSVAARYDLMNDAMSGGMHRLWKDRFVRRVKPRAGEAILDMAGGTGDIAFRLARAGADVTVADINPAMLEIGMPEVFDDTIVESPVARSTRSTNACLMSRRSTTASITQSHSRSSDRSSRLPVRTSALVSLV